MKSNEKQSKIAFFTFCDDKHELTSGESQMIEKKVSFVCFWMANEWQRSIEVKETSQTEIRKQEHAKAS